jgi:predicted restriction endonuclease
MKEIHLKHRKKSILKTQIRRYGVARQIILEKYNNKCSSCGTNYDLCIHHIDLNGIYSKKPNNDINNLTILCMKCHSKLHRSIQMAKQKGGA